MMNGYFVYELNAAFKKYSRIDWELIFYSFGNHTRAQKSYHDFGHMYMMGGEL